MLQPNSCLGVPVPKMCVFCQANELFFLVVFVALQLQNAILEYDEHTKQSRFKFGVLTQDAGQVR